MPGCGQPRLPSGKVTSSAEMTVTWSAGTPASLATSATTGSITDCGRAMVPEGFSPALCDGGTLDEAAEQPPTIQTATSRVMLAIRMARWYAEGTSRRQSAPGALEQRQSVRLRSGLGHFG